jgi:hypothetical protein
MGLKVKRNPQGGRDTPTLNLAGRATASDGFQVRGVKAFGTDG